jgi:antitoxin component of MazEF toxin-antitoxin module
MGEITSISKASTTNESLRTTIPRAIVKQFDLTYRDQIEWIMKVQDGELIIQVKPIKKEG